MTSMDCREIILSEQYYDYIVNLEQSEGSTNILQNFSCYQQINNQTVLLYATEPYSLENTSYSTIPKCYGLMALENLTASGIYQLQQFPGLNLSGRGVMVGFVDTGIDYESPFFRNADGSTRIEAIWDQTLNTGTVPREFLYGSEYTREQIDQALQSDQPASIVPSRDDDGHGSALASIAAASTGVTDTFFGAAPEAEIAVVKLKQAKQNLKGFYGISSEAAAYAEGDLIAGIWYLHRLALARLKSLVLCIGLGTSQGDHSGGSVVDNLIRYVSRQRWRAVVVAAGNEGNERHHFSETIEQQREYHDVELRVGEGVDGFAMELWGERANVFTVSILSPSGERIPRIPVNVERSNIYRLLFDQTEVIVDYQISEGEEGTFLALIRFFGVASGIWTIRVYPAQEINSAFHMWLPIQNFLTGEVYFLQPDPYVTITGPSTVVQAVSVGAYDAGMQSLAVFSGRGFNLSNQVKPDIVAPGVEVSALVSNERVGNRSGTSASAAITAGAVALLFEWAVVRNNDPDINGVEVGSLLIRGANRSLDRSYPNREWGYGTLDLYGALQELQIQ